MTAKDRILENLTDEYKKYFKNSNSNTKESELDDQSKKMTDFLISLYQTYHYNIFKMFTDNAFVNLDKNNLVRLLTFCQRMVSIQEVYHIKTREKLKSLLTLKQRELLGLEKWEEKEEEEEAEEEEKELDDTLDTLELVVIHMLINDNEYKLIHAFPGDNPAGLLVNTETDECLQFNETHCDHIGKNRDDNAFLVWYKDISQDFMDFGRLQSLYMAI